MGTTSENQERLVAKLTGRVQGVGFRFFTRQTATRLGLTGWVRNDPEGSVTVVAEGDRQQLEELADSLREGPRTAVVEQINLEWEEPDNSFSDFTVRR